MFVYCLHCAAGKCVYVAQFSKALFDCTAISPKQVQHTRKDGHMVDMIRDLLPGYLFLYFEEAKPEIDQIRAIPEVIRCLSTTEKQYELTGDDEAFALMIRDKGGVIGKTPVYQENERIRLTEGAFEGLEAVIKKVDRRNSRMQIEVLFAKRIISTWVEYEIVEKVNDWQDTESK